MDEKKIRSDREQYRTDQEQYREDPAAERKTEDMIREMAEEIEIPHSVTPEAVEEAEPPTDMLEFPGMRDELRRPMMLLVRARARG